MDSAPKRKACGEWLLETLREGPLPPGQVAEMAVEAGYTKSTLFRARQELGEAIVNTQGNRHPHNEWALADDV